MKQKISGRIFGNSGVRLMISWLTMLALTGCASLITGGPLVQPGKPTATLTLYNAGTRNIDTVMISGCNYSSYGMDRLPEGVVIRPRTNYNFTVSVGCWDVGAGLTGVSQGFKRIEVMAGRRNVIEIN